MATSLTNARRGKGLPDLGAVPHDDHSGVARLLALCPAHQPTPLHDLPDLAARLGVGRIWVKDEAARMGLGSFKALGAAYAIAAEAEAARQGGDWATALQGRVYVTASAGNHGLSVAAGARIFGAKAVIYLADTVPESFARRLREQGAEVVRAGATYEDSLIAAEQAASAAGDTLLSDGSWPGYVALPSAIMAGYMQLAVEASAQMGQAVPSHIFLQAGVGGLAAAVAVHARQVWGDAPQIIVVEPDAAPALVESVAAGRVVDTSGPVSAMGRLDCKTPSMVALAGLARDADVFVTISEQEAAAAVTLLAQAGLATTPSGGAGVAAVLAGAVPLGPQAQVLVILSEGSEDA